MWQERDAAVAESLAGAIARGDEYLGDGAPPIASAGPSSLRGLPNRAYDRERKALRHHGPYLPIIVEACQEAAAVVRVSRRRDVVRRVHLQPGQGLRREARTAGRNPSFQTLVRLTAARLHALDYDQTPALVGPPPSWVGPSPGS